MLLIKVQVSVFFIERTQELNQFNAVGNSHKIINTTNEDFFCSNYIKIYYFTICLTMIESFYGKLFD